MYSMVGGRKGSCRDLLEKECWRSAVSGLVTLSLSLSLSVGKMPQIQQVWPERRAQQEGETGDCSAPTLSFFVPSARSHLLSPPSSTRPTANGQRVTLTRPGECRVQSAECRVQSASSGNEQSWKSQSRLPSPEPGRLPPFQSSHVTRSLAFSFLSRRCQSACLSVRRRVKRRREQRKAKGAALAGVAQSE